MKRRIGSFLLCASFAGCAPTQASQANPAAQSAEKPSTSTQVATAEHAKANTAAQQPASQVAPATTASERAFGAPLKAQGAPVAVATVLADPTPYLGKVVKAEGTVARVCQRAGCWLELATSADAPGLRVPMANHAFFIPADAIGRPAIVEGELSAQALPDSHREHLAGEGAKALGPLFLQATGVVVR